MSAPLRMIELRVDIPALVRFLQDQGLNTGRDEDLGYGAHAWLKAAFGDQAPKPFRLLPGRGVTRLLGYTRYPSEELKQHAITFATPAAAVVCDSAGIAGKTMPEEWPAGRRLGFEVLACPVSRKEGTEKDVFLRHVDGLGAGQNAADRADVYRDWLARQMSPAAELASVGLDGFRLIQQLRRRRGRGGRRGVERGLIRPHALLQGELTVTDGEAFAALLARGVGRHRAFGYGMLLLRPPR